MTPVEESEAIAKQYVLMKERFSRSRAGESRAGADLTAKRIRRANPNLSKETTVKLSADVRGIIRRVREYYGVLGPNAEYPREEKDIVETLLRHVAHDWPADGCEGANESVWIMDRLTAVGDELYARYLFVTDIVCGGDVFLCACPELVGKELPPL